MMQELQFLVSVHTLDHGKGEMMRAQRGVMALGFVAGLTLTALTGGGTSSAQTYSCNAAYAPNPSDGSCIPDVPYDLNCDDIGWAVYQLYDVNWDPYGLDVWDGAGNGWTCDGIG